MGEAMGEAALIEAREAYPLRQMVLRPSLHVDQVAADYDHADGTFHVGYRIDDQIVAIMSVLRDEDPNTGKDAWRIRSMASHPDVRGSGCGGKVLEFGMAHAMGIARLPIWCNARRVAYGFYERYGFVIVSDEFEIEGIGPHKVMRREADRN
jgi:predicted GNAT family N-acyltransferase